jgi:signal transduction histidine kinase
MNVRDVVRRYGDQLLAAVLALLYLLEIFFSGEVVAHRWTAAVVAVLLEAALAVRRSLPLLPLLAAIVVIQLNHTVLVGMAEGGAFMVTLIVAIYSAGAHTRGWPRVVAAGLVAAAIPLAALDPRQPPQLGDWIFFFVFAGAPFVTGVVFRRRRQRDVELAERAVRAEVEGELRAEAAVTAERARIARELHDVVSHAISVVVVQARGGRRTLPEDAGDARQAFDTIEHAGEQALVEMRHLLEVLRASEQDPATLDPAPGIDRIDALVSDVDRAGLAVDLVREGEEVELPPGVALSAYRIVQEALTNVLKHAGPARARVVLRYATDELEIEITDDGDGSGVGGGSGHGLDGIRERVGLYGGCLQAGRRPEGGYAVLASLPLGARS